MNNYKRRRFETLGDKYSVCLLSLDDGKRMNDVDDVVAVVRVSIFDIAASSQSTQRRSEHLAEFTALFRVRPLIHTTYAILCLQHAEHLITQLTTMPEVSAFNCLYKTST